jgi:hypothetical protein
MLELGRLIACARSVFFGKSRSAARRGVAGTAVWLTAAFVPLPGATAVAADQPSWLAYAATDVSSSPPIAKPTKKRLEAAATKHDHQAEGPDTEHIFGITMGSDIGEKGEVEVELETFGGIGKRSGSYLSTATHIHLKYTVSDKLRIAPGFTLGTHNISGVADLDDRSAAGLHDASVEIRYKLLDRHVAPFGWTLNFEPIASRIDDVGGQRIEGYGVVLSSLIDKEIIPNRLFGAFNIGYLGGASRLLATNAWSHDSDLVIGAGLSYQFFPTVLFGVETRYLQAFEGLGLDRRKGEALFVGPTFSISLAKNVGLSGTWNFQVAGRALNDTRSLDLTNFERNQALLRLTAHF